MIHAPALRTTTRATTIPNARTPPLAPEEGGAGAKPACMLAMIFTNGLVNLGTRIHKPPHSVGAGRVRSAAHSHPTAREPDVRHARKSTPTIHLLMSAASSLQKSSTGAEHAQSPQTHYEWRAQLDLFHATTHAAFNHNASAQQKFRHHRQGTHVTDDRDTANGVFMSWCFLSDTCQSKHLAAASTTLLT